MIIKHSTRSLRRKREESSRNPRRVSGGGGHHQWPVSDSWDRTGVGGGW